ncbi:MAG: MBL fold metallo-hydrolase [Clostridium sp.]|nr:MBL fold metallo-hydrolase [Clostridium sp.]
MSRGRGKQHSPLVSLVIIFVVLLAIVFARVGGNQPSVSDKKVSGNGNLLVVHYLDIGQGDCEFIELPDNRCMLIDAATADYSDKIVSTISDLGYSSIDYLVATHPHADHIGGMRMVIETFDIGEIYMPKAVSNTKTYENVLETIQSKGLSIHTAKAGKEIFSNDALEIQLLAPVSENYSDTNNYSAVVKITYGANSFLFTGDAEKLAEDEMLTEYYDELDSDVLKAGHHGSRYSSSQEFLEAVTPEYAVISCGNDNSYGHPHKEALNRLSDAGCEVLRTDELGDITIACDGNDGFDISYDGV